VRNSVNPATKHQGTEEKIRVFTSHPYITNLFHISSPFPPSTVSISLDFKIGSSDSPALASL